jgi:hypothetical protein
LISCVSNQININLPRKLSRKQFWRIFASIRLSSVIKFCDFWSLDGKRVDTGNAFSNSNFSMINFGGLFLKIEDLCEVMEVIGKYESVRRNFKQVVFDESISDIWKKDLHRCLLENGLERVVIYKISSEMFSEEPDCSSISKCEEEDQIEEAEHSNEEEEESENDESG